MKMQKRQEEREETFVQAVKRTAKKEGVPKFTLEALVIPAALGLFIGIVLGELLKVLL